jgi:S-formylglutathione hydrolase FrmB
MKTRTVISIVFFVFILAAYIPAQTPQGLVQEGLTIESKILKKTVRYTIYLPSDYATSNRYYPVVYLLHGYSDNDMGWLQFGEANITADEAIANRTIPPMILVMPDGGVSWYINNYDNSVCYEDFFIKEFIPYIESKYRIRAEKSYRGVAGLSMGGFGSLIYSLKHSDMFAACAAFSAAIFTDEEIVNRDVATWKNIGASLFGPDLKGSDRLTAHYKANNPIDIVKTGNIEKTKSVKYYIDCGDDDFLYKGNSAFHVLLRDLNIPHEYRVRDGGHTWTYWRTGLLDGLKFIGTNFRRQ